MDKLYIDLWTIDQFYLCKYLLDILQELSFQVGNNILFVM